MEPLEYLELLVVSLENHRSWRANTDPKNTIRVNVHWPSIPCDLEYENYVIRLRLWENL
jgi:hypothetical protein